MITTFEEFNNSVASTWKGVPLIKQPELFYLGIAITEEAGEFAGQVKKVERDDGGIITDSRRTQMLKELGDQLFYMDRAAEVLGSSLAEVATMNNVKLADRRERGVLGGDGNNR
jgi:NTP pyrophosphatase (non-canonical NTP hydrolase)